MSLSHSPKIVTDGLVLCLDAANPRSYPKSGTTWSDLKGSIDGTLTNMDVSNYSDEKRGTFNFDGASDYINLNNNFSTIVSPSLPATWSSYVYLNASNSNQTIIGSAWANGGFLMRTTGTSHAPANRIRFIYFTNGSNGTGFDSADSYSSGWYNFVGVYNGAGLSYNNFKYYLNGYQAATTNPTFGNPNAVPNRNFAIGGVPAESTAWWSGKISLINIYNRVLTDEEILQNYNALKGRFK